MSASIGDRVLISKNAPVPDKLKNLSGIIKRKTDRKVLPVSMAGNRIRYEVVFDKKVNLGHYELTSIWILQKYITQM